MFDLQELIKNNRLPHALLIVGGKKRAHAFARSLVGATREFHPDLHILVPEGEFHHISALRTFLEDISLTPFEAEYKVFVIEEAERMQPVFANALLKILEEPPPRSVIFLLTPFPDKILVTLRSRCQIYHFPEEEEGTLDPLLDALAGKGEFPALEKVDHKVFEGIMKWYRDLYITHLGISAEHLFYPQRREEYFSLAPVALDEVEKKLALAEMAAQRGLKFPYIMQQITQGK